MGAGPGLLPASLSAGSSLFFVASSAFSLPFPAMPLPSVACLFSLMFLPREAHAETRSGNAGFLRGYYDPLHGSGADPDLLHHPGNAHAERALVVCRRHRRAARRSLSEGALRPRNPVSQGLRGGLDGADRSPATL